MTAFVVERFCHWAATAPDSAAIVTPDRVVSYVELERLAAALAGSIEPGDRILVATADRALLAAALLACAASGATAVPVDVDAPVRRLDAVVAVAVPDAVIADVGVAAAAGLPRLHPGSGPTDRRLAAHDRAGASLLFPTSGSTGVPRLIRNGIEALDHFIRWEVDELRLRPGARVSNLTSPGYDAVLRDLFVPLTVGGVVCVPPSAAAAGGVALGAWLGAAEVEVLHCVPTVLRTLSSVPRLGEVLPRLRVAMVAGEPLRPSDVAWWRDAFGERVDLLNLYGSSETMMIKLFHRTVAADATGSAVPVGRPLPGVRAAVEGPSGPVAPGDIGEITVEVPFALGGYVGLPPADNYGSAAGLTGAAARRHRTGDLGLRRDDGLLECLGRGDDQVKVHGVRVELTEVEAVLRGHPDVVDVAVIARSEPRDELVAYVIGAVGAADLRRHAHDHLVPTAVPRRFVALEAFPRTLTGKVDRRRLPAPPPDGPIGADEVARTSTEQWLAELFCEQLAVEQVGRGTGFFDAGGDSVAAARLVERIGEPIGLRAFLEDPTVAGVARRLDTHAMDEAAVVASDG